MQPSYVESTTHSNKVLGLLLISYAMIVIDNSVVITGLPSIKQQLAMSDSGLAWISSAYSLTFGGSYYCAHERAICLVRKGC